MDDVIKNMLVEGKWIERGADVREQYTLDADQSLVDGRRGLLWIQGAQLRASGGGATFEHHVMYKAKFKKNFGGYALGTGDPMYTFTAYCSANNTCADVTVPPPSGDDCFASAAATTATIPAGECGITFDAAAS